MSKSEKTPTPSANDTGELFQEAAARGTGAVIWTTIVWLLRRLGPVRRWRARKSLKATERAARAAQAAEVEAKAKLEKLEAGRAEVLARAKQLHKPVVVKVEGTSPLVVTRSDGSYNVHYPNFAARMRAIERTPAVAMHSTYHLPKKRPLPVGQWTQAMVDEWLAESPERPQS